MVTEKQALRKLERAIADAGGLCKLAQTWGISAAYLSDARHGKRGLGPKILANLGLKRGGASYNTEAA